MKIKLFIITATAPTPYQLNALRSFGLEVTHVGGGRHQGYLAFNSEREAKDFLISRADWVLEDIDRLDEAIGRIEEHGSLELDGVVGAITEIEVIKVDTEEGETHEEKHWRNVATWSERNSVTDEDEW